MLIFGETKTKIMKVKLKEESKFTPIELTITIESEEELCNFWHRTNAAQILFKNTFYESHDYLKHKVNNESSVLWNELDNLVHKFNLKK